MTHVRLMHAVMALVLVVWQAASSLAPAVVFGYAGTTGSEEMLCTCPDMPGATCPMHHERPHEDERDEDSGPRWCSTCPDLSQALLSLMASALGAPVTTFSLSVPQRASVDLSSADARALDAVDRPLSPPPRR